MCERVNKNQYLEGKCCRKREQGKEEEKEGRMNVGEV